MPDEAHPYDPKALCSCAHTAYWHRNKGLGGCDDCGCSEFTHMTKEHINRFAEMSNTIIALRTYAGEIELPVLIEGQRLKYQILVREVESGDRAAHIAFRRMSSDTWSPPQRIEEAP